MWRARSLTCFVEALGRPAILIAGWSLVATIVAAQAYVVAVWRGTPQPWWPSLDYALAIFVVWALLTPLILTAVGRIERSVPKLAARAALYALGGPVVAALHVGIFATLFWPFYNDGGRIASRAEMGALMFSRNFDTNTLIYLALLAIAILRARRATATQPTEIPRPTADRPLVIRAHGRTRLLPLVEIDWIAAADDYAEIHAGGETHLIDQSLAALERTLPADAFARVHRGAIVRLDRIATIRSRGRGDASLMLRDGAEVRLSRRYRTNLTAWLDDPACPAAGSRLPDTAGAAASAP